MDLSQLNKRSAHTHWELKVFEEWIDSDWGASAASAAGTVVSAAEDDAMMMRRNPPAAAAPGAAPATSLGAICILAGSGTGKSTVSAALWNKVGRG